MQLLTKTNSRLFYGWVVVAVSFVIFALIFGSRYCFGVFFTSLEHEFGLTRMATSSIFSTYMVLCPVFAILGGRVLDRYGPRLLVLIMGGFTGLSLLLTGRANSSWQLFLAYSVIFAIGTGPGYSVLMSTTSRWFEKKRGLALAITASGGGLGTIVLAPFAAYLIGSFDWRTAFAVLGLLVGLGIAPLSIMLKKDPAEIGMVPDGAEVPPDTTADLHAKDNPHAGSITLAKTLQTRTFWFLGIAWFSFSLCLHLIYTHIVPCVTDMGISSAEAAVVLGLIGSIGIPGRLVIGVVSDKTGRKVSAVICGLLQVGAMIWVVCAREVWMFYLFAIVYGFASGGFDIPVTALIGDIFGVHRLGEIMGILVIGWGLGAAIGPAFGGFIFDVTENYLMAFMVGAIAMIVATLCVAIIKHQQDVTIN